MKILRYIAYGILLIIVAIALLIFGMRFADGPMEIIAGGPFTSGQKYSGTEPDWSFVRDRSTVEFQLEDPARSRVTWIVEHEGKIYIPCGYMNSTVGKLWKHWPFQAEKNGNAILRIDGMLYDRQLVRIKSGPEVAPVGKLLAEKYNLPFTPEGWMQSINDNDTWLFEMTPRS